MDSTVTEQQLYLFSCLYLTILDVVAVLTRATLRRLAGALTGAAAMGGAGLGIIAIGESTRLWHFVMTWEPYLTLMWMGMIPCVPLPHHVAYRPTVWRARSGSGCMCRRSRRATAGLLVHGKIPGVGLLRAGVHADARNLRGIHPVGDHWPRFDVAGSRSCRGGSSGPPPMAIRLILRRQKWDTDCSGLLHLAQEPGAREIPVAFDRRRRDAQSLADFIVREPAKVSQFHHLCGARIQLL
jgi:hypothetical protein